MSDAQFLEGVRLLRGHGEDSERRLDIAGDAEGHERDHVRAVGGAVARLGGRDAAQRAAPTATPATA